MGERGQALRRASGVDTAFDLEHNLALANRDAGHPELALDTFLQGRALTDVLDPDELDESRGGAHYGNIGRCLHFMGQIDSALVCYQKSALLLEKYEVEGILKQGFIRRWIGELLIAKGQYTLGAYFLEAARLRWKKFRLRGPHISLNFKCGTPASFQRLTTFPATKSKGPVETGYWVIGWTRTSPSLRRAIELNTLECLCSTLSVLLTID